MPSLQHLCELEEPGCTHMTFLCKAEFCYVCLADWSDAELEVI